MATIVIEVAIEAVKYLVGPISRGARPLFCFNQFIGDVGNVKDELLSKLEEVKMRRDEATRRTEEIMPTVKKWLDDVEAILQEVQKLQQEAEEGGKKCFNVSLRYSLANKDKQMRELKNNSHFEPFSYLIQLPGISYFSSKGFVDFNSRKSTYNSLLEAIKDGKNKMVGLYGIGGSGKTTLAKEVGKKVDKLKLFERVIMVVVSKPPEVVKIQQEIADQIGLNIKEEIPSNRAQRLSTGLKDKKILIILDDVWNTLDLLEIGIPLDEGCCILLTTRLRNVCVSMECDSVIELTLLTEEEAWALFKMHANITTNGSSNDFDDIGRKIVYECKGLPIAIVAVGSTLKGKSIEEWKLALWELQHSRPLDVEEGLWSPYACLKLSYDNLPSPVAKSLFLMCSMFPKDHDISKDDLIRFSRGTLELDDHIANKMENSMENSRTVILSTINKLIDSCLLMPTDKQEHVKMHGVVRDVALLIAKERCQAILVDSYAVSNVLNKNKTVNDTKVISLWNLVENFKLSIQLSCPTLEILLLHPREFITDLGGIEALKVLALVTFSFDWDVQETITQWSMPQSIVSLTNLSSLCLRGIALGDISFLGKLKRLEILDLRGSSFIELPTEIVDMKMLKLLDVFGCSIKKSPYEVIGRCEQLQELYLWNLKTTIPENFTILGLKRYVICDSIHCVTSFILPSLKYFAGCDEAFRAFCIQGFNVSMLRSTKRDLLLRANFLWLDNCRWDNKDLNSEIRCLVVSCCPEKRVIVDNLDSNILQKKQLFSHLVTLKLIEMNGLEHVFQDSSINCSLKMLQELYMEHCPQLHDICFPNSSNLSCLKTLVLYDCPMLKSSIFTPSIAQCLVLLEELSINHCDNLKHIIAEYEGEENDDGNSNAGDFSTAFQNLRTLDVGSCTELQSIIPLFFAQCLLRLESLSVQSTPKLKYVVGGRKDDRVASVHQMNEDKN